MTFQEIIREYGEQVKEIRRQQTSAVKAKLIELGLNGFVRRKSDGKVGKLFYSAMDGFSFYPLTKSGELSMRQSGYVFASEIEAKFEPYEEATV